MWTHLGQVKSIGISQIVSPHFNWNHPELSIKRLEVVGAYVSLASQAECQACAKQLKTRFIFFLVLYTFVEIVYQISQVQAFFITTHYATLNVLFWNLNRSMVCFLFRFGQFNAGSERQFENLIMAALFALGVIAKYL